MRQKVTLMWNVALETNLLLIGTKDCLDSVGIPFQGHRAIKPVLTFSFFSEEAEAHEAKLIYISVLKCVLCSIFLKTRISLSDII